MNDTNTKLKVAKNIKHLMANKKINRKQLAEDLDIKYSTLCEWLKGNKMPRPEKLDLLAKYFNTSVDHFFTGLDDEFAEDHAGVIYPIYDYIPANVDVNEIPEERVVDYETVLFTKDKERLGIALSDIYEFVFSKFAFGSVAKFIKTDTITESDKFYFVRFKNGAGQIAKVIVTESEYIFIPSLVLKGQPTDTYVVSKDKCDVEILGILHYVQLKI